MIHHDVTSHHQLNADDHQPGKNNLLYSAHDAVEISPHLEAVGGGEEAAMR
jgi:hypothetical protein